MRKLLRADFERLKVSKTFWLGLAVMLGICVYLLVDQYHMVRKYAEQAEMLESIAFSYAPLIGFFCAMIASMVLGADYNDGTIRNKLSVGHRRLDIYLSQLIICFVICAALQLVFIVPVLALGMPFTNGFAISTGMAAAMFLLSFFTAMAYASICTAIAMGIQNRTAAVIAGIALIALLLFIASVLGGWLGQPEMSYDGGFVLSADGIIQAPELVQNPYYITGMERTVYQWIYDLLPTGQSLQIVNGMPGDYMARWPFTSALVILLSSAIGYSIFKRKDIK